LSTVSKKSGRIFIPRIDGWIMWSTVNPTISGLQRSGSSSGDGEAMELSQSMDNLNLSAATVPHHLAPDLLGSDALGGSAYAHSLGVSADPDGELATSTKKPDDMDLATSTDECFAAWMGPPNLTGCEINPATSLRMGKAVGEGAFSTIFVAQYTNPHSGVAEMVAVKRVDLKQTATCTHCKNIDIPTLFGSLGPVGPLHSL
jgi:hypothetical protein